MRWFPFLGRLTLKKLLLLSILPGGGCLVGELQAMSSSCLRDRVSPASGWVFTSGTASAGARALLVKNTLQLWCNQRKFLLRPQPALQRCCSAGMLSFRLPLFLFLSAFLLLLPHSNPRLSFLLSLPVSPASLTLSFLHFVPMSSHIHNSFSISESFSSSTAALLPHPSQQSLSLLACGEVLHHTWIDAKLLN